MEDSDILKWCCLCLFIVVVVLALLCKFVPGFCYKLGDFIFAVLTGPRY